ncbi:MAG: AAA family ATPase [Candidatus Thermoplasmatota archaeon]|nr:AAA family ATPase [Candidatus Thermoplasmatota archaeon]
MFEEFDEETIQLFKELSEKNPFELLSKYICPELVGEKWRMIRKSTLLLLVTEVDLHCRHRLHELLWGDAGTGKTVMLSWIEKNIQGVKINAEMTSKTGLVGDARGNSITGGLLHQYDSNIVCIDELDKMNARDQNGLLQAMEEGEYMIVKGKKREKFRAEIRAIASANELEKITKPLLDRFDFIFYLEKPSRSNRAEHTPNLVKTFLGKNQEQEINILTSYLEWIKDYEPTVRNEKVLEKIIRLIQLYIHDTHTDIDAISFRNLEHSILRISYALAKLEKNNIETKHVKEAIMFKDKMLQKLWG